MTKSSNRAQTARMCSAATGASYVESQRWFDQGLISRQRPVPEAATTDQRRLEAIAACELAEAFGDSQLDGALLGIQKAKSVQEGFLRLEPHPAMAYAVVHRLLPHHDHDYGGLRGVPGLRPHSLKDGLLVLIDSLSTAGLVLQVPSGFSLRPVSSDNGDYDAIWHDHPDSTHESEEDYLHIWSRRFDAAGARRRDLVFSRLLRRPGILRRIGTTHRLAHTWSHWSRDIVIEWCCGASELEVKYQLGKSGFTDELDGVEVDGRESEGGIWWGDTGLDLRHVSSYVPDEDWASNIAAGYKIDAVRGRYPFLHRHPPNLRKISPAHLEVMTQALFTKMGWGSPVPSSVDTGEEYVLIDDSSERRICVVQVKHVSNAVGADTVLSFVDLVARRGFHEGILVTTGRFTTSARESAVRHKRIQLIDGDSLVKAMAKHLDIALTV
ncbi:restriction endonuclease [Nocardia gipuzkoensis]